MAVLKVLEGGTVHTFPGGGSGVAPNAVTAAATLAANVIPVGVDGTRKVKDNTGGLSLISDIFYQEDGNELLALVDVGISAVNFIQLSNHVTNNNPIVAFTGDDTDVGGTFNTKNAGTLELNADTNVTGNLGVTGTIDVNRIQLDALSGVQIIDENGDPLASFTRWTPGGSPAVNYLIQYSGTSGQAPGFDATGSDADVDFLVVPKGAGQSIFAGTASLRVPSGTTAERPFTPVNGDMRYNSTTSKFEIRENGAWINLGGGGSGDVVGPGSATNNAFARFDTTTGKLIQDSKLLGADVGVSGSLTDLLTLVNDVSGTSGTETSLLFRQEDSGATLRDAARIAVGVQQAWTATASTRDSFMAFHTSLDGTVSENMRIHSSGRVVIHDSDEDPTATTVEFLSVLNIGSSCGMGAYAYRPTATGTAFFSMNRARESGGAKTALVDNDNIARFFARGWDGAAWRGPGRLDWLVDGAVSSGVMPIEFRVITGNSGSGLTRLTVRANGDIEIGGTLPLSFFGANNFITGTGASAMTIESPTLTLNTGSGVNRMTINSTGVAFNGASPAARPNYTVTNPSTIRTIDTNASTLDTTRKVLGTLIDDLIVLGLLQ